MLEEYYLHKPLHLVNNTKVSHNQNGTVATEFLEVALMNVETGGLIESKDIIENLLKSDSKVKNHKTDDIILHLKHTRKFIGRSILGWVTKLFGINKNDDIRIEHEFFLVINNPLWVPILIKSIIVESPKFPEIEPHFKNIWTVPLNDNLEAIIKHLYKRIRDKDCIGNDMILIQPIDWEVGKLTDIEKHE